MTEDLVRRRLFREVNERIRGVNLRFGAAAEICQLLCECGDAACVERVEVPPHVFEEVREVDGRFVVAPAHTASGRVVAETRDYAVVAIGGAAVAA